MPKYMNGASCCWSMASQRRSSAAMRSSNQWRIGQAVAALGGGGEAEQLDGREVVEQPARTTWRRRGGTRRRSPRRSDRAARSARPLALRLWIEAKTCSKRCGSAPPTHFSPKDGVAQGVAEGGEALVEDLLAVGDEQQAGAREPLAEAAVVEGGHHGLAGAGGGDEEVAVVALLAGERRSARAAAPGTAPGAARSG